MAKLKLKLFVCEICLYTELSSQSGCDSNHLLYVCVCLTLTAYISATMGQVLMKLGRIVGS